MKKQLFLFGFVFLTGFLFSQEQTLVGNGFHSGGYGGPVLKIGSYNSNAGVLSGGRGAWIINHTFAIGGGGYNLTTKIDMDRISENGKDLYLGINYGGVELEYIHNSDDLIHWTIHATIGGGTVFFLEKDPREEMFSDGFFVIEPTINMDINIAQWFRIGVGLSYFAPIGVQLEDITSSDLSGPTGSLVFKFGSF